MYSSPHGVLVGGGWYLVPTYLSWADGHGVERGHGGHAGLTTHTQNTPHHTIPRKVRT